MSQSSKYGYGTNTLGDGKRVVIEFSSPNIAKPFHAGHMRSTVIGTVLSNLYAANGWEVIRLNYATFSLGDWGTQYGLLAVGFEKYGSEEELEKDPIQHLFKVYVAINNDVKVEETQGRYDTKERAKDYFNRLEKGDPPLTAIWKRFRELSIFEYIKTYERLGVQFDVYAGESLVPPEIGKRKDESRNTTRRKAKTAAPKAEEGGNGTEDTPDDGLALAVDLEEFNLGKPVLQKPDGSTIYMVRDIAGAIDRYNKYHFDKMLYVVGDQQNLHFAQCFKILSLLEDCPFDASEKLEHINFGRVEGMATRSGDVVFLKEILDVAQETMMNQMKASPDRFSAIGDPELTSDQIGMTAVKVQDMRAKRIMSYPFDWNRMTSFEGDTGPYLQYAHVRLCSMERKVGLEDDLTITSLESIDTSLLLSTPKAREIVFYLAAFPDVVRTALKTHEPSNLVTYCFKLAHLISSAWETIVVKGLVGKGEKELAEARLLLYICARNVLGSAMRMLSLTPLERM
ncbi:hypothetical protein FRC00_003031 [Tulasnella sp. 408]|nr:hypothetical protein FRC00_003031 [Tulasnella sp. 408]